VRLRTFAALPFLAFAAAAPAAAANAHVAALQVALHARGLYAGAIDGIAGPQTRRGVIALQRRAGLEVDGVPGPQTFAVLGGNARLGARVLALGMQGLDVAALQFALAAHGFPSGTFDGSFGPRTQLSLRRFQRFAHLSVDARAGPATVAALAAPAPGCPVRLARPLAAPVISPFGPRGTRFHSGIDLPAPIGAGVAAAAPGYVSWAAWRDGGWGELVVVAHRGGVRTMYAHLSRIEVRLGEQVAAGFEIGRVGATGDATGPHLHFEVRFRGAAVNPLGCF
jgi:murein DD-endopeptidase MepM/ murein hydrolase activator NlpD